MMIFDGDGNPRIVPDGQLGRGVTATKFVNPLLGRWRTNCRKEQVHEYSQEDTLVGPPLATEKYTAEQLEADGLVGLYDPPEKKS